MITIEGFRNILHVDAANDNQDGTVRGSVEAGALVRGSVRAVLKTNASFRGIELELNEDKHWLRSEFHMILRGKLGKIKLFLTDVDDWFSKMGGSNDQD